MATPQPYVSHNSMKRVFPGDAEEVVEISPPINWTSKSSKSVKHKEVIFHEIIDVDVEEDWSNVKPIEENVEFSGKEKGMVNLTLKHGSSANSGAVDGVQSSKKKKCPSASEPIIIDDFGYTDPATQVSSRFGYALGATRKQGLLKRATTTRRPSTLGPASNEEEDSEVVKKLRLFKRFDTVLDHSDHYYSQQASSLNHSSKSWTKKIQEEWKILEKHLPDTIFVRVYETRLDLLRAVIMGADGTPYHDGLFFFDVLFPSNYPNVPPHVHYQSFGLRLNPNLYACGKVCLSLLNTWSGRGQEKWVRGVSTMLQVLVSIQGLILNAKPYFNEPGYASTSGTPRGEESSLRYNEDTYILNLKTMVYSMNRPPKHFEDFVLGHFLGRAQDILVAFKAYTDGAQVGSLVKGGVQDVDEGDKSCSQNFKASLAGYRKTLTNAFTKIGAKDCDKFLAQR